MEDADHFFNAFGKAWTLDGEGTVGDGVDATEPGGADRLPAWIGFHGGDGAAGPFAGCLVRAAGDENDVGIPDEDGFERELGPGRSGLGGEVFASGPFDQFPGEGAGAGAVESLGAVEQEDAGAREEGGRAERFATGAAPGGEIDPGPGAAEEPADGPHVGPGFFQTAKGEHDDTEPGPLDCIDDGARGEIGGEDEIGTEPSESFDARIGHAADAG